IDHLLRFSIRDVETLLSRIEPPVRQFCLEKLISKYAAKKNWKQALDLLDKAATGATYPYASATELMLSLPKNAFSIRENIFANALTYYKNEPAHSEIPWQGEDFGTMIVRFGEELPAPLVLDAVSVVLERAKESNDGPPNMMTLSSGKGTASFSSEY